MADENKPSTANVFTEFRDNGPLVQKLSEKDLDIVELKSNFYNEIAALKSIVHKKEEEIIQKDTELRRYTSLYKQSKTENLVLKRKIDVLKTKKEEQKQINLEDKKSAKKQVERCTEKEVNLKQQLKEKDNKIFQLEIKVNDYKRSLTKKSRDTSDLETQQKQKIFEIEALMKERTLDLVQKNKAYSSKNEKLRDKMKTFKQKIYHLKNKLLVLENEKEKHDLVVTRMKFKLEEYKQALHKMKESQKKQLLILDNGQNNGSESSSEKQKKENNRLRHRVNEIEKKFKLCVKELEKFRAKKKADNKLSPDGAKNKNDSETLKDLKTYIIELEERNAAKEVDFTETQQKLSNLEGQYNTLVCQVNMKDNDIIEGKSNEKKFLTALYSLCQNEINNKSFIDTILKKNLISLKKYILNMMEDELADNNNPMVKDDKDILAAGGKQNCSAQRVLPSLMSLLTAFKINMKKEELEKTLENQNKSLEHSERLGDLTVSKDLIAVELRIEEIKTILSERFSESVGNECAPS